MKTSYGKIYRKCETCGNEFVTQKCWVKRGDGRFCSIKCTPRNKKAKTGEHKRKISEALRGKPKSEKHIAQMIKTRKQKGTTEQQKLVIEKLHLLNIGRKWTLMAKMNAQKAQRRHIDNSIPFDEYQKERQRLKSSRRRALERNATGFFTITEWDKLKKQHNYSCSICDKKEPEIKITVDHIIPLSRGGSNYIDNIQPLCSLCNFKKHTKTNTELKLGLQQNG